MSGNKYYKIKFFDKSDDDNFIAKLGFWAPDEESLENLFKQSDQAMDYSLIYEEAKYIANTRFQGFGLFDADENIVCIFNDEGTLLTFSRPYNLEGLELGFLKVNKPDGIPIAHLFNRLLSKIQNG